MIRSFSVFLALLLLAGCGGGNGGQEEAHEAANAATEGSAALVAPASYEGIESTTLVGSLGCGHCTHHMGTSCSAALQTADGAVYILDGMKSGDMAYDRRFDGLQLEVVGQVAENEGTSFVKVASIKEL